MGIIDNELQEVRKLCENVIPGSKLVTCVMSMVRVEIRRTVTKTVIVCLQFPDNYPSSLILIELKSKTLSEKLLTKLTNATEQFLKKVLGKPQILQSLKFIQNFIVENPLCACYDEISEVKKLLLDSDELKLKQKTSSITLKITEGKYYVKTKFVIPEEYPIQSASVEVKTNFPPSLERFLVGQTREIARRCVEPPIRHAANYVFKPSPSFLPMARIFITAVRLLPKQHCQLCKLSGLPDDPQDAETDESADLHIERMYCNHLFHLDCFLTFMKTPPFEGGKRCPECGDRLYHHKWRISDRIAENRWSHEEARKRELEDVAQAFM